MEDNTIEIHDGEINVEEIMAKIRETIRCRQAAGELPLDANALSLSSPLSDNQDPGNMHSIDRDLSYIISNSDIHNYSYFISSHRPCIGRILIKGRQLVHQEVRRYVDPMVSRQTEFNTVIARVLSQTSQKCSEFDRLIPHLDEKFSQKIFQEKEDLNQRISREKEDLNQRISQEKEELSRTVQINIESSLRQFSSEIDKNLRIQMGLTRTLDEQIRKSFPEKNTTDTPEIPVDLDYLAFENRFRGPRELIKQRQMTFLPYFKESCRVLDIGCGRGEFLEILRNNDIGSIGIDIDEKMVFHCRSCLLNAEHGDAIAFLEKADDNSYDGIFIDQVVEHLEPAYLIRLLALCYRKLKPGYSIVIETVNPLSFVSFVNFYIDMSHKRHIHPETLQYLMGVAGFRELEIKFLSQIPETDRLKKMTELPAPDDSTRKNIEIYNHNIEILNAVLFGPQDYAVIGKK